MPTYRARFPDGSSYRLEAPSELSSEQISTALQHHLNAPDVAPLLSEGLSKAAFPIAGAIGTDIAFGAPLTEAGATIGTAIAPGVGTAIGGGLGAGLASFLGATAGERLRQRLATAQTGQPLPSMSEAVKTAAPFGAFGLAGEGAAALSPFLRSGKVLATALKSGIGGTAAGAVAGLARGERLPAALKEGVREAPLAAALGGAFQAIPNSLQYVSGNQAAISADRAAALSETDRQVLAYRNGKLPSYLSTRGHEIWQSKVADLLVSDQTPIPLKEFYDHATATYGEGSLQAATVLKAFGRDPQTVMGYSQGAMAGTVTTSPTGEVTTLAGENPILAKIFESDQVAPQQALNTASELSGHIKGGAASGFRRGFSFQDTVNADARSTIYDVLKSRLTPESQQAVNEGLQEYGEFATLKNIAIRTLQPYANQVTPTAPGRAFLTRLATGKSTPDDTRLAKFIQEATGQPQTQTGVELTGNLPRLFEKLQASQAYGGGGRYTGRAALRYGLLYPAFRALRRGR